MSVELYKKGEHRDVNGLMCDVLLVAPELFNGELPEGWFFSAEAAHGLQVETEAKEKDTEEAKENEVLTGNAKIRHDAKAAGIGKWETARIETLKAQLSDE